MIIRLTEKLKIPWGRCPPDPPNIPRERCSPDIWHPRGLRPPDPLHPGRLRSANPLHLGGCAPKPQLLGAAPSNPCSGSAS